MRHIATLAPEKTPPRENEFNFRKRAKALVDKWHQILNANKPANGSPVSAAGGQRSNGNADADKDKMEDEVTSATKNLDLNWKGPSVFLSIQGDRLVLMMHLKSRTVMRLAPMGIWMRRRRRIHRFCLMSRCRRLEEGYK